MSIFLVLHHVFCLSALHLYLLFSKWFLKDIRVPLNLPEHHQPQGNACVIEEYLDNRKELAEAKSIIRVGLLALIESSEFDPSVVGTRPQKREHEPHYAEQGLRNLEDPEPGALTLPGGLEDAVESIVE